jgi:Flp pilus assembly protein TadG
MKNISHNQKGTTAVTFSVVFSLLAMVAVTALNLSHYDSEMMTSYFDQIHFNY